MARKNIDWKKKVKTLKVIYFSDIPFNERLEQGFDDVSYGDAAFTLVSPKELLFDRRMHCVNDGKGNPVEPTESDLNDEENLQPLAYELYKISKLRDVYIALDG